MIEVGIRHAVVIRQAAADAAQRASQFGRRGGTRELGPKLLGGEANFQRFAMHVAEFRPELLQRRPRLIDVLAALLDLAALPLDIGGEPGLFGRRPLAFRARVVVQQLPLGGQLLVELLQGLALGGKLGIRFGKLLLASGQALGLAANGFILQNDRAGLHGGLCKRRLLLLEPEPGRARVALQLGCPGVQLGFAMIQFFLPPPQMFGELRGLAFHVLANGRRIGRQRLGSPFGRGAGGEGRFAIQHFQIDAQVGTGCLIGPRTALRSAGGRVRPVDAGFGD